MSLDALTYLRIHAMVFLVLTYYSPTVYVAIVHRVSNCTVYPKNTRVFCYISRNRESGVLECFAFLCCNESKVS